MKKALSLVLALTMLLSLCIVPVMAAEPDGSAENPYFVTNPMMAPSFITIPANSTVYYQYNAMLFNGWEVGGYGLSAITVDGIVYDTPDMWGEIYAPLNFTMMSPGLVGYVNDTAEDVEVMLSHTEPVGSESNPAMLEDGDNALSIPANIMDYVAVYVPMVNGEHTFSTEQAEDFQVIVFADAAPSEGGTPNYVEDGSLTLTLESYVPVYVVITPVGMTGDVVLTVTPPVAGTEENPIWLDSFTMEESYVLGNALYFQVDGTLSGNTLNIAAEWDHDLTVIVDGVEYVAEGGKLSLVLDAAGWYIDLAVFQLQDVENTLTFSIEYAEGSYENPIELVDGDNAVSVPENAVYYYQYTSEQDGLLVITPADTSVIGYLDIYYEDAEDNVTYGYLPEGAPAAFVPIPAGQTALISVTGVLDEETSITDAVDTVLNVTIKDLLTYNTFETGELEGWTSSSDLVMEEVDVANGFYSVAFNVTKDWGNIYRYVNVEANTDYEVSFKAKATLQKGLWIKFNDNWGPDVDQADLTIGTEWAEYTAVINSGDCTSLVLLFQYAGYASDGQVILLDDILITKAEPGDQPGDQPGDEPAEGLVNGDFENGSKGWELGSSASITEEAAHGGNASLKLENPSQWAAAAVQTIPVKADTDYVIEMWVNRVQGTAPFNLFIMNADDNKNLTVVEGQNWFNTATDGWVKRTIVVHTGAATKMVLKWSSETNNAGILLVDDMSVSEKVAAPVADGLVNGDFETGDNTGWETWQSTEISADAAHGGSYGANIKGNGSWGGMLNQTFPVESGKSYKLSFWYKVNSNGFNMQFTGVQTGASYAGTWAQKNEWTLFEQIFTVETDTEIKINFCGGGNGIAEDAYIDDIQIVELNAPSFDGYVTNGDFETGDLNGWENLWGSCTVEFVEGYESSNAVSIIAGGWSQVRQDGIAVEPDTDYVLTAWVKNAENFGIIVKKGDDSGDIANAYIESAGDWTQVTVSFNSGDQTAICVLLIGWEGGGSAIIDNVSLAEDSGDAPVVPPVVEDGIVNGDFETGDNTGWETWQSTEISADAAHTGSYGANIKGNGSWGGMLNQTFNVEPGKSYKLTFWYKVNSNGFNMQFNGVQSGASYASTWAQKNEWTQFEQIFTVETDTEIKINFCGGGNGVAEDAYIDDVQIVELKAPSFDGYVTNGDFETGDLNGWENLWGSCTVEFVEGYESSNAVSIIAGGWSQVRQNKIAVKANTNYVLTAWVKNTENFGIIVKKGDDSGDIANAYIESAGDWTQVTVSFNSGDQTEICVLLIGWEGGGSAIIDNVSLAEDETPVEILYGDVDGNGKINNRDLGLLQQYLNDIDISGKTFDEKAADMDGNGKLNNRDLGLLQKELNK